MLTWFVFISCFQTFLDTAVIAFHFLLWSNAKLYLWCFLILRKTCPWQKPHFGHIFGAVAYMDEAVGNKNAGKKLLNRNPQKYPPNLKDALPATTLIKLGALVVAPRSLDRTFISPSNRTANSSRLCKFCYALANGWPPTKLMRCYAAFPQFGWCSEFIH